MLGWQPKVDLAEGFDATLRALRQEKTAVTPLVQASVVLSVLALLASDW